MLTLAGVTAFFTLYGDGTYPKLLQQRANLQRQRERNDRLALEVAGLRRRRDALLNDPRVLEQAARDQLGMVQPNDLIFVFGNEGDKSRSVLGREGALGREGRAVPLRRPSADDSRSGPSLEDMTRREGGVR